MANRITGSTDVTGAISVRPKTVKSLLIVCENGSTAVSGKAESERIYTVTGTNDASTKFGTKVANIVKVLINNGVDNIKCIAVGEYGNEKAYTTAAKAYEGALDKTLGDTSIKTIILDVAVSEIITVLKSHLAKAEGEDMFRYGVIGLTSTDVDSAVTEVGSINEKRIFAPFPNFVDESNLELDGIYAAAGLASLIMTETSDPAMPMNGVEMVGFGGTTMPLLKSQRTILEQGGVTGIVGVGAPAVWRLVTTRTKDANGDADPIWHEGTTLFIADDVLECYLKELVGVIPIIVVELLKRPNIKRNDFIVGIVRRFIDEGNVFMHCLFHIDGPVNAMNRLKALLEAFLQLVAALEVFRHQIAVPDVGGQPIGRGAIR